MILTKYEVVHPTDVSEIYYGNLYFAGYTILKLDIINNMDHNYAYFGYCSLISDP